MKLSIIIPYYNGELCIAKCLDSLLHQNLSSSEYEIIVVDDGSTHHLETLMSYVDSNPNIHYLYQKNNKHATARNNGLSIAKGDYVFFCDCDDFVEENVMGNLYNLAKSKQLDVLLFNFVKIQEHEEGWATNKEFVIKQVYKSGLEFISQPPYIISGGVWQFIVRRSFLIKENLKFAPQLIMCEERHFFLQMMLVAKRVAKVNVDVYYYVQHPESWVHKEGKINHCNTYVDSITYFIQYLSKVHLELAPQNLVSEGCIQRMRYQMSELARAALLIMFRYSTLKYNLLYIKKLRAMGCYPIKQRLVNYDWLRKLINIYPLWLTLCCLFHIQPLWLRRKIY